MPFDFNVNDGVPTALVIIDDQLLNTWQTGVDFISHTKNIKSEFFKTIDHLKIGSHYKITFEVYDWQNCTVQFKLGEFQLGNTIAGDGIYSEYFTVRNIRDRIIRFISDGILKIRNIIIEEKVFSTSILSFNDVDKFENKSWTISYSIHRESWRSWHSYLPNYYFHNQDTFHALRDNHIWKFNKEGLFHHYFGEAQPFIIEYVPAKSPIEDKVFETLILQTTAKRWDSVFNQYTDQNFITFNTIIIYNTRQSTGELVLKVKDIELNPQDWYQHQITNIPGTILISKEERNWNINEIRDHVEDYTKPLFSSGWNDIKFSYFIDRVQNNAVISFTKNWADLQSLRGKFAIVRLKFDTFNDISLTLNYSLETEQISVR